LTVGAEEQFWPSLLKERPRVLAAGFFVLIPEERAFLGYTPYFGGNSLWALAPFRLNLIFTAFSALPHLFNNANWLWRWVNTSYCHSANRFALIYWLVLGARNIAVTKWR